jgi:hypothetical protein
MYNTTNTRLMQSLETQALTASKLRMSSNEPIKATSMGSTLPVRCSSMQRYGLRNRTEVKSMDRPIQTSNLAGSQFTSSDLSQM